MLWSECLRQTLAGGLSDVVLLGLFLGLDLVWWIAFAAAIAVFVTLLFDFLAATQCGQYHADGPYFQG